VTGTQIYNPRDGAFTIKRGPIFGNLVLADEINRAPAKVQAALLEAMQERQVTLGEHTLHLPEPFLVLATQNPIEHVAPCQEADDQALDHGFLSDEDLADLGAKLVEAFLKMGDLIRGLGGGHDGCGRS